MRRVYFGFSGFFAVTLSSADSTEDTWSAKYSCSLGEDTFTVTITREYMLVNGFEKDETLKAVESWADTVPALGGEGA